MNDRSSSISPRGGISARDGVTSYAPIAFDAASCATTSKRAGSSSRLRTRSFREYAWPMNASSKSTIVSSGSISGTTTSAAIGSARSASPTESTSTTTDTLYTITL